MTADVLDFDVPDDLTVAYVYNPFSGAIFEGLLQKLIESVDRAPRRLRLIYRTPLEHERVMATRRFRVERSARGFRPGREWSDESRSACSSRVRALAVTVLRRPAAACSSAA